MTNTKISVKEIFERLVAMETELNYIQKTNRKTVKSFTWYAIIVIILSIINVLVHIALR